MDDLAPQTRARLAERTLQHRRRRPAFTALDIYERDRGICGICRHAIDADLRWPHPMSLVLDHVRPVGSAKVVGQDENGVLRFEDMDGIENIQAAHRLCNSRKSNSLERDHYVLYARTDPRIGTALTYFVAESSLSTNSVVNAAICDFLERHTPTTARQVVPTVLTGAADRIHTKYREAMARLAGTPEKET